MIELQLTDYVSFFTENEWLNKWYTVFYIAIFLGVGAIISFIYQWNTGRRQVAITISRRKLYIVLAVGTVLTILLLGQHILAATISPQLPVSSFAIILTPIILSSNYFLYWVFPKKKKNSYFILVILSLISAFGNALAIYSISSVLKSVISVNMFHFILFNLLIACIVICQKIVRTRLINLTSQTVYEKRVELIKILTGTTYQKFELMNKGKIMALLNHDANVVSSVSNMIVSFVTNVLTMLFCFVYLSLVSFYGFLFAFVLVVFTGCIFYFAGQRANKGWMKNRETQDLFYQMINSMINGYKEMYINANRRESFKKHIVEVCEQYKQTYLEGDMKFTNVIIIGQLLFIFVIGLVAFGFPVMFPNLGREYLIDYVFVFLYMAGPLNGIFTAIPSFISFRISWKQIQNTIEEYTVAPSPPISDSQVTITDSPSVVIELKDVFYTYKGERDETFTVGPVSAVFSSGEIVFITGGNGSGKSTLAKLITGLYHPNQGEILFNGRQLLVREQVEHFSVIFSDYYLMDRLYGIDCEEREEEIAEYIRLLRMEHKVSVSNGTFVNKELSTGQKKRLAFIIALLEDRPIVMLDEWAADQDPEFRTYFYEELLPYLRDRNKCVIAITHDDRYFHYADRVIKMESGMIVSESAEMSKILEEVQ
ncbi:cyclic peptide export ABC transporter [Paenibacillus sp. GbtcB18]|uniref:cyclic peptide export ABC transporter n=1 Tax=Paenibacillus sp. GbtcB18 TaxID=2824763 RepID=UPI001C303DF3|nr:cyclic peptide export ABC transporter [Paenibacillus sp. GbtcB18]